MAMTILSQLIHGEMIAGCVAATSAEEASTFSVVSQALGDGRFHFLSAQADGHVYYLAVSSRSITHDMAFSTPLAIALPDHPQHLGDGVYVFPDEVSTQAVLKHKTEFLLMDKSSDDLSRIIKQYGLKFFQIEEGAEPRSLRSPQARYVEQFDRVSQKIKKVCRLGLATTGIVYVVLTLTADDYWSNWISLNWVHRSDTADLVRQIQYTSPLTEKISRFQQVSAVVIRSGGWVNAYLWKHGEEAFDISLPGWISRDYIEALGPGTIADFSIPDNLVMARKGDVDALSKK